MKKKFPIPGWLLPAMMAVYTEVLLHFATNEPLLPGRLAAVVLFALGIGCGTGLITGLLPLRAGKWFAVAVGFWFGFIGLLQFYIQDAYGVFMSMTSVLATGEGVLTGYADVIVSLLTRSLWQILLVMLPVLLYAVWGQNVPTPRAVKVHLAAFCAIFLTVAALTVHAVGMDKALLSNGYNFDAAVRGFGANTAVVLDAAKGSGSGKDVMFEIPETQATQPPVTAAPAQPAGEEETVPVETTEPPVVYGPQVYDLDFAALAQEESDYAIASIHSYVAAQTPTMENDYTGMFEGKNLILITAEAFASQVIDPELTPTLYRMATEGIRFTDYYHPVSGCGTTGGEFGYVVGMSPTGGTVSMMEAVEQNLFLTIGNQLQNRDYFSMAFHNNDHTYYDRHKTHTHLGYDQWYAYGNGMEEHITNVWTRSDEEMFDHTVPMYIGKEPFSVYYMTVSGHASYSMSNGMSKKNYHLVEHLDASETLKCYLACQMDLELAMASLIRQLEDAGIADDTVVVITTDHYPYGLAGSNTWGGEDYLHELYGTWDMADFVQDSTSLIIWSGCLEDKDIVVDDPTSVLDVLPTLLNLFGADYDSRLLPGRDVFSDSDPLVYWPVSYSWITDKASYNGRTGVYEVKEGAEVDEGYKDRMHAVVRNKMVYCRSVQDYNYFNTVSELMGFEK